jgi:hypothetical protein
MKSAKSKIKKLVIEIAVILGLVAGAIAFATNGLDARFPSIF